MGKNKERKNLLGQKFSMLTVVKLIEHVEGMKGFRWECLCECGNTTLVSTYQLGIYHTQSCGCYRLSKMKTLSWKGFGEIGKRAWSQILRHAKSRNIEVTVTIEDIWNLFLKQDRKCKLTGVKLHFPKSEGFINVTASLDRIDSSKGYHIDNIQWVHREINRMKWDLPQEDFLKYCKLVSDNIV